MRFFATLESLSLSLLRHVSTEFFNPPLHPPLSATKSHAKTPGGATFGVVRLKSRLTSPSAPFALVMSFANLQWGKLGRNATPER